MIRGGKVKWKSAFNLKRAILVGQTLAIVALLTVQAIVRARRSRQWMGAQE